MKSLLLVVGMDSVFLLTEEHELIALVSRPRTENLALMYLRDEGR